MGYFAHPGEFRQSFIELTRHWTFIGVVHEGETTG